VELIGLTRAGKVTPGAKWRATWGVSWQGDLLEVVTPANLDAARLQKGAWAMVSALPALGLHIYSVTPPAVDSDADAFTLDLAFSSSSSTSDVTVEQALQALENVLTSYTLARVALIGSSETAAAAQKAREAATTGAKDATGVTLPGEIADATGAALHTGLGWLKTAGAIVAVIGGLIALRIAQGGTVTLPLVGSLGAAPAARASRARGKK
jgi:hypothetical protein